LNSEKSSSKKIGLLTKEVGNVTNVKLNALYIVDRKDEVEYLQWTIRIIQWVLDQTNDKRQQLGVAKICLELEDTNKFENMLHEKIQELEIELEESCSSRELDIMINEIETLKSVLYSLSDLKYGNKKPIIEIAEADTQNHFA
jgi:hypothetical protein